MSLAVLWYFLRVIDKQNKKETRAMERQTNDAAKAVSSCLNLININLKIVILNNLLLKR